MIKMELCSCYNLDECINRNKVITKLKFLKRSGKIDYAISGEILKIDDIDLEDNDIEKLLDLFEENDIFEEPDCGDDRDDYIDFGGYDDDYDY